MSLDITLSKKSTCEHCGQVTKNNSFDYDTNITHNLHKMANAAGLHMLWIDGWMNTHKAGDLIKPLTDAINDMEAHPEKYKEFGAENGWGTYKDFLPWLQSLLRACIECPEAEMEINS